MERKGNERRVTMADTKGADHKIRNQKELWACSLVLSNLQKYLIGEEVLDQLAEQRRSTNFILRLLVYMNPLL